MKRKAKADEPDAVAEEEEDQPMPSADDSESSDAQVVVADQAPAADDLLVPVGTEIASASAPSRDLVPTPQWTEHLGEWWFRADGDDDWTVFREQSAPVPGLANAKGLQKGKRKRGTSPRYQ